MGVALLIERDQAGHIVLRSTWPLMAGQAYDLHLDGASGPLTIPISVPADKTVGQVGVSQVAPSGDHWPANTLRFHISFATPMARGQVEDFVSLIDAAGRTVPRAFLNLGVELWSADQKRLTVMFDPGRLKRGVGPNAKLGAPLVEGETYAIRVSASMADATNRPLSSTTEHWFVAGPAEHRSLNATDWLLSRTSNEIRVRFDRSMDTQSVVSMLRLREVGGDLVAKQSVFVGNSLIWHWPGMDPDKDFELVVGPGLEDVSGNTICAPFDAPLRTGQTCRTGLVLPIPHPR
ncbi:MAG: hypothetical protein AAGF79_02215 [Pseudomonadota bacterium]